jgi:hypothetical protein
VAGEPTGTDVIAEEAIPNCRVSQAFRLAPPPALTPLAAVSDDDDRDHPGVQKATPLKDYIVHAELDRAVALSRQHELAELLQGHQPTISLNTDGGTEVRLAISGQDLWQSILEAMVALTNARCTPTVMRIAQVNEGEKPHQTNAA